jgi:drug/metabolite transporter (DMT)-like permease
MKHTTYGILAALGAAVSFSVIDMVIKLMSEGFPLYQLVFMRTFVALPVLLCILVPLEGGLHLLRTKNPKLHAWRAAAVIIGNLCFFTGLAILPLAEAVAIAFATPLIVTLLSVVFLKETVGPWRWGALIAGFSGVLIIMRPGSDAFQPAAILPLLGAFGYAIMHVLARATKGRESGSALAFYPMVSFFVLSVFVGLTLGDGRFSGGHSDALEFILRAWTWPSGEDWKWIALLGIAGSFGGYLVGQAYRLSEATLVAPFEYIAMPLAVVWGVMLFDEWPDQTVWLGSALIIGAGLVSVWRETVHRREPVEKPQSKEVKA